MALNKNKQLINIPVLNSQVNPNELFLFKSTPHTAIVFRNKKSFPSIVLS